MASRDPALTIIGSTATGARSAATGLQPPRDLGQHGLVLWREILAEFDIKDRAGLELLCNACQCLDRAEALAEEIRASGLVVHTPQGLKSHPCIKEELAARGSVVRFLKELGVTLEALRSGPGRPAKQWRG